MAEIRPFRALRYDPAVESLLRPLSETVGILPDPELLRQDMDEGMYLHRQDPASSPGRETFSLICLLRLEDFSSGVVLARGEAPEEEVEDRFRFLRDTGCNAVPVSCLYDDERRVTRRRLDNLAKTCRPRYDFLHGSVRHRLWVINDPVAIAALRDDFVDRKLTISAGLSHYEAALRYHMYTGCTPETGFVMASLTDAPFDYQPILGFAIHKLHGGGKT